jgi:hypothetical protein
MTEPDLVVRRRGPFGLVLAAERIARVRDPRFPTRWPRDPVLPLILGPAAWVSFDLDRERWRIRRPDGTLRTTASVVTATLEVARLLERTAADLVVERWTREVLRTQREVAGG